MDHRMSVILNKQNEIIHGLHYEKHPYIEALNNLARVEDAPGKVLNH